MAEAHAMRALAREIFLHALAEAGIEKAFARHVSCERGVLRIGDDLYDLKGYSRVLAVSFVKAGHRMAECLARQGGPRVPGAIRGANPPSPQRPRYRHL